MGVSRIPIRDIRMTTQGTGVIREAMHCDTARPLSIKYTYLPLEVLSIHILRPLQCWDMIGALAASSRAATHLRPSLPGVTRWLHTSTNIYIYIYTTTNKTNR